MHEQLPENRHPLNQKANELLRQAGQHTSPGFLHLLNLMSWTLEQPNHGLREDLHPILEDAVSSLLNDQPKRSLKWLLYDQEDPSEPLMSLPELENLSPLEAGQLLLDLPHRKLSSLLPNYPPPSPR